MRTPLEGSIGGPCPLVNLDSQSKETVAYGKFGDRNGVLVRCVRR